MSDIVERLKEPEIHYPGNFDTPKRANAMLSCLCQEAAEEIEALRQQLSIAETNQQNIEMTHMITLREVQRESMRLQTENDNLRNQLAASQLREQQLREALLNTINQDEISELRCMSDGQPLLALCEKALALPQDTSALDKLKAEVSSKAGEVMRRSVLNEHASSTDGEWQYLERRIRTIPGVTLENLK